MRNSPRAKSTLRTICAWVQASTTSTKRLFRNMNIAYPGIVVLSCALLTRTCAGFLALYQAKKALSGNSMMTVMMKMMIRGVHTNLKVLDHASDT